MSEELDLKASERKPPFGYINGIPCVLVTDPPQQIEVLWEDDKMVKVKLPDPLPHIFGAYDDAGKLLEMHMSYLGLSKILHAGARIERESVFFF